MKGYCHDITKNILGDLLHLKNTLFFHCAGSRFINGNFFPMVSII